MILAEDERRVLNNLVQQVAVTAATLDGTEERSEAHKEAWRAYLGWVDAHANTVTLQH